MHGAQHEVNCVVYLRSLTNPRLFIDQCAVDIEFACGMINRKSDHVPGIIENVAVVIDAGTAVALTLHNAVTTARAAFFRHIGKRCGVCRNNRVVIITAAQGADVPGVGAVADTFCN